MRSTIDNEAEMLREIVRGERPLTDLTMLGLEIESRHTGRVLRTNYPISAKMDIQDVARGFLFYKDDREKLRDWAFLVEAVDSDLNLSENTAGELIGDALWKACFGEPIGADVTQAIEQLIEG